MSKQHQTCLVCGERLEEPHVYGDRLYCETHLSQFSDDLAALWQTGLLILLSLAVLVGTIAIANAVAPNPSGPTRLLANALVIGLPSIGWLILITQRLDGEDGAAPSLVSALFVLGSLMAAAVVRPLTNEILALGGRLAATSPANRFVANVLILGMLHAFVLYGIVRYSVWRTTSFSLRVHGVLYASAAGLGYAATQVGLFALERGGLSMLSGGLTLLTRALPFATASLIVGYFLGINRFENQPFYYLPSGVALAGAVCGVLLYAGTELNNIRLNITTDGFSPWPGFVVNVLALTIAFGAVYGLLQRQNTITKARLRLRG
ncbi:MAG: hypothetical protein GYB68_09155 [Chloroflexi bacterium]|nr:hypothetical protein [Chloroflexota bacterium]